MSNTPTIPGVVPSRIKDNPQWNQLPFLWSWIVGQVVTFLIVTGLSMATFSIASAIGIDPDQEWMRYYFSLLYAVYLLISFMVYRWSVKKFLLSRL